MPVRNKMNPSAPNDGVHPRTLLVDATYLIKRSFSGAKHLYTQTGKGHYTHIGALYAFLTTLRMLSKQLNPNKIVLCWDGENGGKMRYRLYPEYKANRENKHWHNKRVMTEGEIRREEESKKSFLRQKLRAQEYCQELFMRQIEVDEMEADDLAAYYVKLFHKEEKITIFTNDRDYLQLLNYPGVQMYLANKKTVITENNFFLHFKHALRNSLLVKSVTGDESDNIKGIPGIKEATLLKHFPGIAQETYTISRLLAEAKQLQQQRQENRKKPLKVLDSLISGQDTLRLNEKLMDLSEPMLSKEAKREVQETGMGYIAYHQEIGSQNLMTMMQQDGFLSVFGGDFVEYVKPFYSAILWEKNMTKTA